MTSVFHGLSGVLGGFNEKMADLTKFDPITSAQFKLASKVDKKIHKSTKPPEMPEIPRQPEAPHLPQAARRASGIADGGIAGGGSGGLVNGTLLSKRRSSGRGRTLIGGG